MYKRRVLQYVMSDLLFRKHPQEQEGGLTHQRALLVCEAALAQVARKLGVGHVLRMDKGAVSYTHLDVYKRQCLHCAL